MQDLVQKLEQLWNRLKEIGEFLNLDKLKNEARMLEKTMAKPDFWKDAEKARETTEKHAGIKKKIENFEKLEKGIKDALAIARKTPTFSPPIPTPRSEQGEMEGVREEIEKKIAEIEKGVANFEVELLFRSEYDKNNAIVSFHAGTGGTDAQDWAEMLLRMLSRYAERKGFRARILDEHRGGEAGIKSATISVEGQYAYGYLKSEHGVHRLVRISPFDAEKMRHTSFALIEVLPELAEVDIKIDPKDLKIDTFLASGHGGQSVQKTESAVRITHIPSGIAVACQTERSQAQNKDSAMKILRAKLFQIYQEEKEAEKKKIKGKHKAAAWSNQIRSYVLHPYKLVKDHRTEYEETDPEAVLDGKLERFVEEYLKKDQKPKTKD